MTVTVWLLVCSVLLSYFSLSAIVTAKYVEGHLKTLEDWTFVARFCFLSGHGRYEYFIEFERRYGEPKLLLYYDEKTQWPAVYKTGKTCQQKLSVLSASDNQIVTLSTRPTYSTKSGCFLHSTGPPSVRSPPPPPASPEQQPAAATTQTATATVASTKTATQSSMAVDELDSTYFDKFLKATTSTTVGGLTDIDVGDFNETDTFNVSTAYAIDADGYRNRLENSSDFADDVELMFDTDVDDDDDEDGVRRRHHPDGSKNSSKIRRSTSGGRSDTQRAQLIVTCSNMGGFMSSRKRWWYIAVSNCGSDKGINLKYKFRMTNGEVGDFWHEHFSADEMYIPPILLAECIAYAFLLLTTFLCAIELKSRHLFHCTYRLFTASALTQIVGVMLHGVAWAKYGTTGLGPRLVVGSLFMGASEITFLALLLLMAKGFTITRARLSTCATVKLTVYVNVYIVAYIALFVYQSEAFDPGEVLNLYESPAGLGLISLRIVAWGVFVCSTASTIRKYPEKGAFYYPFGLLGSMWLLGGPLLMLIGIGVLDPWVRESVMCAAFALLAFAGHAAFLWLTWPSRANKSFPYHVRTNHVGIAGTHAGHGHGGGGDDDDDGDDYPRHTYEPALVDPNLIISMSRRTDELLNSAYNGYVVEHQFYNQNSTPLSHVSFPRAATAPPPPSSPSPPPEADYRPVETQQSFSHHPDENVAVCGSVKNEQTDSGHPSMEQSPSGTACAGSPKVNPGPVAARGNDNPFLVNGVSRQPNKVILEPIQPPVRTTLATDSVPRHLFAARRAFAVDE